jgi:chromosome segregation ATPase
MVARADSTVQQVQSAIGNNEAGAVDLQRARDTLARSKEAMKDYDDEAAQRLAQQAELDAQLAVAKTQHATARKAADELQASIRTMRQEAQRTAEPVR